MPGGSCLKNIDDLFDLIEKIKKVPGEALKYPRIPHTAKPKKKNKLAEGQTKLTNFFKPNLS